jgi:urease accessory protein
LAVESALVGAADRPRARSRVGRDGVLRLAFERRGTRTVLARRLYTTPLQVLEPLCLTGDGSLVVMALNPTGGLAGGDRLDSEIDVGHGAHVCFTTPSATKVYRTSGARAVQRTAARVGDGAIFEYMPDHVIPHAGASLDQALSVEMATTARVIVFDAFAIGRLARGERWAFERLASRVEVTLAGRPVFLDRVELTPARERLSGLGGLEGCGYAGTLVAAGPAAQPWSTIVDALAAHLETSSPARGGASLLGTGGCAVRLVTGSAFELVDTTRRLWALLRRGLFDLPALDLRKA